MWPEGPTGLAILCFGAVYLDLAPYPARGPAAAALPHGVGQQQAVASRRQVEHSLSDDEAHPEENVTGRQKRDHQQHQAQGQRPGREGGRERCQKEESTATTHPELSSRTWWSHCGGQRALFIMTCGSGEARRALRLVYSECEIGLCSLTSASGCPASIRLGLSSLSGRTRAAAATPSSNQWPT